MWDFIVELWYREDENVESGTATIRLIRNEILVKAFHQTMPNQAFVDMSAPFSRAVFVASASRVGSSIKLAQLGGSVVPLVHLVLSARNGNDLVPEVTMLMC